MVNELFKWMGGLNKKHKQYQYHCGWCDKGMNDYDSSLVAITDNDIFPACSEECQKNLLEE